MEYEITEVSGTTAVRVEVKMVIDGEDNDAVFLRLTDERFSTEGNFLWYVGDLNGFRVVADERTEDLERKYQSFLQTRTEGEAL